MKKHLLLMLTLIGTGFTTVHPGVGFSAMRPSLPSPEELGKMTQQELLQLQPSLSEQQTQQIMNDLIPALHKQAYQDLLNQIVQHGKITQSQKQALETVDMDRYIAKQPRLQMLATPPGQTIRESIERQYELAIQSWLHQFNPLVISIDKIGNMTQKQLLQRSSALSKQQLNQIMRDIFPALNKKIYHEVLNQAVREGRITQEQKQTLETVDMDRYIAKQPRLQMFATPPRQTIRESAEQQYELAIQQWLSEN